ncbi:MAG: hypothetical protein H6839_16005 [Planctomycetes bacterium]|nr:hypothetical protein [Planctomycetota bacterium]
MNRSPVFVAIGLVLGLLAGIAIGVGISSHEPRTSTVGEVRALDNSTGAPDDANPLKADRKPEQPEPVRNPPQTGGGSLSEIIAAADVPALPSGNGVISGSVVTDSGEALAGVEVSIRPPYPEKRDSTSKDIEARIQDEIRYQRWRDISQIKTTTDAAGAYKFTGLSETSRYSVWATLSGWKVSPKGHGGAVMPGEIADFIAKMSFTVPIEVRMPDGSVAEHGRVSYSQTGSNRSSGTILENGTGTLELEAGEWKLRGSEGDDYEYQGEEVTITLVAGTPVEPVVLQLAARPGVRGKVSVPALYDRPSLRVYLVADPPADAPGDLEEMRRNRPKDTYVREDPRGNTYSFAILDVLPGSYRLLLVQDNTIVDWKDVTVANTLLDVELALGDPRREDYIVIHVSGPEGAKVTDATVTLYVSHPNGRSGGGAHTVEPGDGNLWVRKREPSSRGERDITDWWYDLTVESKKYGSLSKRIERDDAGTHEFTFTAPATVTLTVPGFNEHEDRASLFWEILAPSAAMGRLYALDRERRDGAENTSPFKFGPMQPGNYELVLRLNSGRNGKLLYREPVVLVAGENSLTASVPLMYVLKVHCSSESEAQRLRLGQDGERLTAWPDDKEVTGSTVEFKALVAGEYTLESADGRMTVTVPSAGVVEFAPRKFDCVLLLGIKTGGAIEALGLREGDKLIEIDGAAFTDMQVFGAQVQLSLTKQSTTWKVLRGGVPTEVTFDGTALMKVMETRGEDRERLKFEPGYRD